MKYAVHLFPSVRVKVTGIEAESVADAIAKAEACVDLHEILDNMNPRAANVECIEWDEGVNNYVLVDPLDANGEVFYDESQWLDSDGVPLVDGKTVVERKAADAADAVLFMQELLDSVESLTGIAEEHGPRTLADLMYLQNAILTGGFIDVWPDESTAMDIACKLPSGTRWARFCKQLQLEQSVPG